MRRGAKGGPERDVMRDDSLRLGMGRRIIAWLLFRAQRMDARRRMEHRVPWSTPEGSTMASICRDYWYAKRWERDACRRANAERSRSCTTKVPASKTASEIQEMLARHGASKVMTEYDEGAAALLASASRYPERRSTFPARVGAVGRLLDEQGVSSSPERAEMVAWRNVKDWIAAQIAIIEYRAGRDRRGDAPIHGRRLQVTRCTSRCQICLSAT